MQRTMCYYLIAHKTIEKNTLSSSYYGKDYRVAVQHTRKSDVPREILDVNRVLCGSLLYKVISTFFFGFLF